MLHLVKKTQNKDLYHAMSYYLIGFVVRILSKITVFGINQIGFKSWSVNAHENHHRSPVIDYRVC
jgi:hypothetical protein